MLNSCKLECESSLENKMYSLQRFVEVDGDRSSGSLGISNFGIDLGVEFMNQPLIKVPFFSSERQFTTLSYTPACLEE